MNQSIQTITLAKFRDAYLRERQNVTSTAPATLHLTESAYHSIRFGTDRLYWPIPFRQSTASKAYGLVKGVKP